MTKNEQRRQKFQAMRQDLVERNFYEHDFRAEYEYAFEPCTVEDRAISSRLAGPRMKTVQWEPTLPERES